jgi:elongation factor P
MATLGYSDLRKGVVFNLEGQPYEVIDYSFVRMQQRKAVDQVKMKNLINGKLISRNFHQNETFEGADMEKKPVKFLYHNKGQFWFCEKDRPANRFFLAEEVVGPVGMFLKPNTEILVLKFNDRTINIQGPVKIDLIVKDAPSGERGNTAQGGTKLVELETGAKLAVPLFVNTGDVVRVNTESGQYVERVEKAA